MTKWNMPPVAKIYEALGAVADGRVKRTGEMTAEVLSSERDKTYTVKWSGERSITSNDNATRWQGYIGYPIIAVLLQTGQIPYDHSIAAALGGVPWHGLNAEFKRDYDVAIKHVLAGLAERGVDAETVRREAERIFGLLAELQLERPEPKQSRSKKDG